ncbi:MAG: hypothetical protein HOV94_31530, partial [Saccharothrix sp.]|nr:hypothetical protein [Saccharothrix sp.]
MADGSTKPISEVQSGDKDKATDPTTGETTDRDVVATIVHTDEDDMTRLTVTSDDGTSGTIDATSWHPVWVEAEGRFVKIGHLEPGDRLTSADGRSPMVDGLDRYTRIESVYDLTVEGIHTYYVLAGPAQVLVHNCGPVLSNRYPERLEGEMGLMEMTGAAPLEAGSPEFGAAMAGSGNYIWSVDTSGTLRIIEGGFNHPVLTGGADVIGAGGIRVSSGRVVHLDNRTGHYRPREDQAARALQNGVDAFRNAGVRVPSGVTFNLGGARS